MPNIPVKVSILYLLIVQEFNGSKFVVFTSLLLFSLLYTLKLDNVLDWSWWSVFIPLWVWKAVAISGAGVGSYVWWRRPQSRLNNEEYIQYKAGVLRNTDEGSNFYCSFDTRENWAAKLLKLSSNTQF